MDRPRAPVLLSALLTFCITAEFGIQQWSPVRRAHWETKTSISLAVEGCEGRSSGANTTFCCKFVSFPEGSQEACGSLFLSTDQGLPAPTPAPMLRADLAGIFGVSGLLLFGCVYLLHLLHRQRHWSVSKAQPPLASPQPQARARAAGQVPLVSLRAPCTAVPASRYCPATLDLVLPRQPPARWAPLPASTRNSFVSVENGLYAPAGERPFQAGPNLVPFPDSLGHRAAEGHLGVR
ncbi:transmembrane protein PVRIG isoform X2 [Mustela erminea]|uniref:transmembrane protein PVRIG isoform X2 n=1 Tax=Mustela erminea TaxID=36723 RepID=UPI0013873B73|nr:transmembrane protein PVRIG isoform X2 [Mustela erminea]